MSTQAVSDGFAGNTTPMQHSDQQSTIPTIDWTDVDEDIIPKQPLSNIKKSVNITTVIET